LRGVEVDDHAIARIGRIDGKMNRADDLFVAGGADLGPLRDVDARDFSVHRTCHTDERREQNQASKAVSHAGSITPPLAPCRLPLSPFPALPALPAPPAPPAL